MALNLSDWLGIGGAAAGVLGPLLGARAQGQANEQTQEASGRLYDLAEREEARRIQMINAILPQLGRSMRLPAGEMFKPLGMPQIGGQQAPQASMTGGVGNAMSIPEDRGGFGSGLKGAVGGAGLGGMLGGGGAGLLGGTALGAKIGMLGGPLGMGIGAAVGALASQAGKLGANESRDWVKEVQDPFGKMAAGVIDPYDRAKASGSATASQQQAAQQELERLISQYSQAAELYRGRGSKQNRTIDQSYETLNPIFAAWRQSLAQPLGAA